MAFSCSGSLNLHNGHDGFAGTGSYFSGFQAGYSSFPSRLVVGLEADVTFRTPSAAPSDFVRLQRPSELGQLAQMSGTVRGRIGYAPGNWLVYATGGLAGAMINSPGRSSPARRPEARRFPGRSKP